MSNQTTVELRISNATPGLIADIHLGNEIISAAVEASDIPFGVIVQRGTDRGTQAIIGGDEDPGNVLGVSVRSVGKEAATIGATVLEYEPTEAMAIMQSGYIFVTCIAGCVAGDRVKFDNTTGALSAGAAVAGETQINNAEWMSNLGAGDVGKIRIDGFSDLTAGV